MALRKKKSKRPKLDPTNSRFVVRPKGCLSPNEAGAKIGCTGENIKRYIHLGRLKAAKANNGYWWIRECDLDELVKAEEQLEFKYHGNSSP